ncbi:MAG: YdcF family protein [Bacteroidota bacterium]|nr:YdcF family protein [Bacteroidota bacterium]
MFNFISKLAYVVIAPENWIIALIICIFLLGPGIVRKRLTVAVILLILFFGNNFIYKTLVIAWQPKPVTLDNGRSYEAGIVLGGSSSFDKYGQGYLNSASDRFIETCVLYKTKKIRKIIISGGSNRQDQPKDADFQYQKMLQLGIPANDIIVEDSSTTTVENAAFTKSKIAGLHLQPPFVLITSAMHVPRAEKIFTKAGIQVIPFPCNYTVLETSLNFSDYFIPKIDTILSWSTFLKEVVGMLGFTMFKKA